ncbi:hypothetical protein M413DRAFT_30892 [Hebeloma cylindrosporum]|uniref:Uncharacterized protein n=1 Tax=Hebeloma cylindrosporum TaxID=76867 RepID=A0A0C2XHS6_HEBCY|nr:hypothetical protein M413DRAFT_30892 [Hebeloma cylindrosporum h7]
MPLVAGLAFSGLTTNSPISTALLSTSDPSFVQFSSSTLGDELSVTAKSLFPSKPVSIRLALPSFLDRPTRKPILQAFKKAELEFPDLAEVIQLAHISIATKDHTPRNEILFHFSPTFAICRLVSTSVEEGIRESTTLRETTVTFDSPSPDTNAIIAQFVDLVHGTKIERIIVIDPSVTTTEATHSTWNEHQRSPVELTTIGFPSVALQAAKSALRSYESALSLAGSQSTAISRIGIVNADGLVHALVPRGAVLPQYHSATFTTSKDDQTEARVSIVIGRSPKGEENLRVGQLVLRNLPKKAKGGLAISVTVDVNDEGDISVAAEEQESGVSEKTVVRKFLGEHHQDELEKSELNEEADVNSANGGLPE